MKEGAHLCVPLGGEMLRTLMKSALQKVRKNVRFFPLLFVFFALFILPISLYHGQLITNEAHANWFTDGIADVLAWIPARIAWLIFQISSLIFIFAGWVFDFALDFSTRGSTYSSLVFINTAWTFIRDLINSTFIFAVLIVAFKQLLSTGPVNTDALKKTLMRIIVAALLINFSLFFTKVAIDASNVLARGLYYRISTQSGFAGTSVAVGTKYGPAHALAQGLDLTTTLNMKMNDVNSLNLVIIFGGGSILMLISALLFFAAAFMFIARIFVLMIVMMTSPLLFATFALDFAPVKKLQKQWIGALKAQAIFPVVYMLVIYIAVMFVRSDSFSLKNSGATFAKAFSGGDAGSTSLILIVNYVIVTALMVYAIKAARDLGGDASSLGAGMQSRFLKLQSAVGRSTIGAAGGALAKSKRMQNWVASGNAAQRTAGNLLIKGGERAAQSSFDVRGTRAYGMLDKQAGGLGAGKAGTKTFEKDGSSLKVLGTMGARIAERTGGGRISGAMQTMAGGKEQAKKDLTAQEKIKLEEITKRYGGNAAAMSSMLRKGTLVGGGASAVFDQGMGETRFQGDAGKDARKAVVAAVEKEFKDNPGAQQKALQEVFGDNFKTGKEFKEVRDRIQGQRNAEAAKATLSNKDNVKAAGAYSKEKHKAAQSEVDSAPNPAAKASAQAKLDKIIEQEKMRKTVADAARVAKPDDIAALDLETLGLLAEANALTQQHLAAIEKQMQNQAFSSEDVEKLNDIAKNLRKNGSDAVKTYLANSAVKDTSAFDINFTDELSKAVAERAGSVEIGRTVKSMHDNEIKNLERNVLFNMEVLKNIKPAAIARYVKNAQENNDNESLDLAKEMIEKVVADTSLSEDHRKRIVAGLKGEGGGKKKK